METQTAENWPTSSASISCFATCRPAPASWSKIEHRLFSFISQNWRAQPLVSADRLRFPRFPRKLGRPGNAYLRSHPTGSRANKGFNIDEVNNRPVEPAVVLTRTEPKSKPEGYTLRRGCGCRMFGVQDKPRNDVVHRGPKLALRLDFFLAPRSDRGQLRPSRGGTKTRIAVPIAVPFGPWECRL